MIFEYGTSMPTDDLTHLSPSLWPIAIRIRNEQDLISGETLEDWKSRTLALAYAELARNKRREAAKQTMRANQGRWAV